MAKRKFGGSTTRRVRHKSAAQAKMKRTAASAARRAVMKMSETKVHWAHYNEKSLNTLTGFEVLDPAAVVEGSGQEERIGTEISPTGFHIKGVLNNNGSSANFVRIVVVKSMTRQNIATGDWFAASTGLGQDITAVNGLDRMYWPIHKKVHQVLWDKVYRLEANGSTDKSRFFNKFLKLGGKLKFDGGNTGSEQSTPRYHIIYMAAETEDDTSLGQSVEVSAIHRLFYKDL